MSLRASRLSELADCSSSSDLDPAVVKLRMRPRDRSALCENPNSTPPTDLGQIFDAGRKYLERLLGQDNNNPYYVLTPPGPNLEDCEMVTASTLRFACCNTGAGAEPASTVKVLSFTFQAWNLVNCFHGMSKLTFCLELIS